MADISPSQLQIRTERKSANAKAPSAHAERVRRGETSMNPSKSRLQPNAANVAEVIRVPGQQSSSQDATSPPPPLPPGNGEKVRSGKHGSSDSGARGEPEVGNFRTTQNKGSEDEKMARMRLAIARLASVESIMVTEERVRQAQNENELVHLVANETRKLTGARQVAVFRRVRGDAFHTKAISSIAVVERDTPFIRWMEKLAKNIAKSGRGDESFSFNLSDYADPNDTGGESYPFQKLFWQPMKLRSNETFAAVLLARETEWTEQDSNTIRRESNVFSLLWQGLVPPKQLSKPVRKRSYWKPALILCLLIGAIIPVPMTTLAPVEIVAEDPVRVTAPIDGVVHSLPVRPNEAVTSGQVILTLDDTTLRNNLNIAEQELKVAAARFDRARQAAFSDQTARHELAIAQNEFRLKQAERDYAQDQLARTTVKADRSGLLVYEGRDKLLGKPVRTGERLMKIADPKYIAAQIELPVADAIVLEDKAKVKLFLDADPLSSISAQLKNKSYQAEPNATQQLVYRLVAKFGDKQPDTRIGARGTAQLQGKMVPMIYFLLRRPIAAVRQYIGI